MRQKMSQAWWVRFRESSLPSEMEAALAKQKQVANQADLEAYKAIL